jgi:hypothetical protein
MLIPAHSAHLHTPRGPHAPTPDPTSVVSQVLTFTAKLSEAIADADELGGLGRLRGKMKPATAARLAEELKLLRAEIDEQLEALSVPPPVTTGTGG